MSEINIPSTTLNKFFNDRGGGKTLQEAEEYVQPTINVLPYLYQRVVGALIFQTEAGSTSNVGIPSGPGTYKLKCTISGFITEGAAAAENVLNVFPTVGSNATWDLLNVNLAISQIYNVAPVTLEANFVIDDDSDKGIGNFSFSFSATAAPAKVVLRVLYDIIRVA